MERKERCENCRFWEPYHNAEDGQCRRNAPTLIKALLPREHLPDPSDFLEVAWRIFPGTCAEDWCGEWQQKEDEDEENLDDVCQGYLEGALERGREMDYQVISLWLEHGRVSDGMKERLKEELELLRKRLGIK